MLRGLSRATQALRDGRCSGLTASGGWAAWTSVESIYKVRILDEREVIGVQPPRPPVGFVIDEQDPD
jgi:hypothetical protein